MPRRVIASATLLLFLLAPVFPALAMDAQLGGLPAHGERSAQDLYVLLGKLDVPKPYILVGHSYGGSVARLFASLYPDDIGGLVLEDTQHEDVFQAMRSVLTGKDLSAFDRLMAERFSTPEHPQTEADYRETTREQIKKSRPLPQIPYVVLAAAGRAVADAIYELELARGVVISTVHYDRAEWEAPLMRATPFRTRVEAEAVLL